MTPPEPGDTVSAAVRYTTTTFDITLVSADASVAAPLPLLPLPPRRRSAPAAGIARPAAIGRVAAVGCRCGAAAVAAAASPEPSSTRARCASRSSLFVVFTSLRVVDLALGVDDVARLREHTTVRPVDRRRHEGAEGHGRVGAAEEGLEVPLEVLVADTAVEHDRRRQPWACTPTNHDDDTCWSSFGPAVAVPVLPPVGQRAWPRCRCRPRGVHDRARDDRVAGDVGRNGLLGLDLVLVNRAPVGATMWSMTYHSARRPPAAKVA